MGTKHSAGGCLDRDDLKSLPLADFEKKLGSSADGLTRVDVEETERRQPLG